MMFSRLRRAMSGSDAVSLGGAFHSIAGFLASYNLWANQRLMGVLGSLDERVVMAERRFADGGGVSPSMYAVVFSGLETDAEWLSGFGAATLDPGRVDDLQSLDAMRREADRALLAFAQGLEDGDANEAVSYRGVDGGVRREPLGPLMFHVFNEQTRIRSEAAWMARAVGAAAPTMGLLEYQRQVAARLAGG